MAAMPLTVSLLLMAGGVEAAAQSCVALPPPSVNELVPATLGIALVSRYDRGEWAYSAAEQEALRKALEPLRAVTPLPSPARPPSARTLFALIDPAERLYAAGVPPRYELTLHKDGRITSVRRMGDDEDPAADSAASTAFARGGHSGDLGAVAGAFGADSVRLTLFTVLSRVGVAREVTWIETPFYERELALYRGTQVAPIPPDVGPRYPTSTGRRDNGKAFASFIVAPNGTIERSTLKIVEASAPEFGEALIAWLPKLRFKPATIEGCPVRALAGLPMEFTSPRR